jgi:hypothetical protein
MHNKAGDSSAQIRRVRPWHTPAAALFCVRDDAKSCLMAQFVMARIEAVAPTIVHGGFIPLRGVPKAEIPVRALAARLGTLYVSNA